MLIIFTYLIPKPKAIYDLGAQDTKTLTYPPLHYYRWVSVGMKPTVNIKSMQMQKLYFQKIAGI